MLTLFGLENCANVECVHFFLFECPFVVVTNSFEADCTHMADGKSVPSVSSASIGCALVSGGPQLVSRHAAPRASSSSRPCIVDVVDVKIQRFFGRAKWAPLYFVVLPKVIPAPLVLSEHVNCSRTGDVRETEESTVVSI